MKYNYNQKRNDYLTPPELVEMGLKLAGEKYNFQTDVCCSQPNIPANFYFFDDKKDGLKEDWSIFNWCNPPFNECEKWVKKAYNEQQKGNSTVLLIPARTETAYWHNYILDAEGGISRINIKVKFLKKGYKFLNPETKEPMGVFKNALALVFMKGIENE